MASKSLHRIVGTDTQLGGVSLGLADYLNIDVTIVRVVFVIMIFTPFPAIITYLILWAVLPAYSSSTQLITDTSFNREFQDQVFNSNKFQMNNKNRQGSLVGGAVLIILGVIFSFKTFFDINLFKFIGQMWPLFLIALGVWLVVREKPSDNDPFDNDSIGGSNSDLID
ncbi:MAG: phage shock protein PspC (stress-responsive transcriptional regulator) [Spirosomataceae bacterium]|jgi:phage shock protein C